MNTAVLDRPTHRDSLTGTYYFEVGGSFKKAQVEKRESGRGFRYTMAQQPEKRLPVIQRIITCKAPPAYRVG